jgi:uncharacterized metal-binding protein
LLTACNPLTILRWDTNSNPIILNQFDIKKVRQDDVEKEKVEDLSSPLSTIEEDKTNPKN